MQRRESALPIAVIGAGFSGTVAAIQLLEALPGDRPILLCERGDCFGRGLAYGTSNPDHLLNVRTANMSAFSDRPTHFESWLEHVTKEGEPADLQEIQSTPAGTFAARGLYGRYLGELLQDALCEKGQPRLRLFHDEVTDLEPTDFGFTMRTDGGTRHAVAGAVLAMGNFHGGGQTRSRHRLDPWTPEGFGRLSPDRPILIVGSGLTMVDAVVALRRHGFAGPIVAISRRGLLPKVHEATATWPVPNLTEAELGSINALLARVRAEVRRAEEEGVQWRGVIDGLRPIIDMIWRSLPLPERARYLRHLRPYWETHRHRMAPPIAAIIADEIRRGSLDVCAGRILTIEDDPGRALVTYQRRGRAAEQLAVQCVIDATGIGKITETNDALVLRLFERGLVRPGPFELGLDADGYRASGLRPEARLWVLGPLLRGVLEECTAVPDIRNQAAELAASVAATLAEREGTSS